jgi:hypothetical protein
MIVNSALLTAERSPDCYIRAERRSEHTTGESRVNRHKLGLQSKFRQLVRLRYEEQRHLGQ